MNCALYCNGRTAVLYPAFLQAVKSAAPEIQSDRKVVWLFLSVGLIPIMLELTLVFVAKNITVTWQDFSSSTQCDNKLVWKETYGSMLKYYVHFLSRDSGLALAMLLGPKQ